MKLYNPSLHPSQSHCKRDALALPIIDVPSFLLSSVSGAWEWVCAPQSILWPFACWDAVWWLLFLCPTAQGLLLPVPVWRVGRTRARPTSGGKRKCFGSSSGAWWKLRASTGSCSAWSPSTRSAWQWCTTTSRRSSPLRCVSTGGCTSPLSRSCVFGCSQHFWGLFWGLLVTMKHGASHDPQSRVTNAFMSASGNSRVVESYNSDQKKTNTSGHDIHLRWHGNMIFNSTWNPKFNHMLVLYHCRRICSVGSFVKGGVKSACWGKLKLLCLIISCLENRRIHATLQLICIHGWFVLRI